MSISEMIYNYNIAMENLVHAVTYKNVDNVVYWAGSLTRWAENIRFAFELTGKE